MTAIQKTFNELLKDDRISYPQSKRELDDKIYKGLDQSTSCQGLFLHFMTTNKTKELKANLCASYQLERKNTLAKEEE